MNPTVAASLTLVSTIVLVGVTAWYAVLTRRLAKSAEASAASAERTAKIAADALSATVAGLDVNFSVAPNLQSSSTDGLSALGVTVYGHGATVYVHRARLDRAWECVGRRDDGASYDCVAEDVELVLASRDLLNVGEPTLPTRLHRGEMLHFETEPEISSDGNGLTDQLEVSIWYSLNGTDQPLRRRVEYEYVPASA